MSALEPRVLKISEREMWKARKEGDGKNKSLSRAISAYLEGVVTAEWQLIETAPKDEELQILVWDGASISIAQWSGGHLWLGCAGGQLANDIDDRLVHISATHWRPLPNPPE